MRWAHALVLVPIVAVAAACSEDPQVAAREALAQGNAFYEKKQYREATIEYRRAVQLDPRSGEARYKLADSYFNTDNAQAGFRELVRAADLLPGDADLQVKAGTFLLAGGRFEDAKTRAEQALNAQPQHVGAHILRGNALAGLKEFDAGLAEMERAIAAEPGRAVSYTSLAAVQHLRGEPEKAEEAFKKAIELDPTSISPRLTYAQYLMVTERAADAEAQLKEAAALYPNDPLVNRVLAVFYIASGRPQLAEPHLVELAKETNPAAQLSLAQLYMASNRVDQASTLLNALTLQAPTFEPATLLLSRIAFARNERPNAYALVQKVLDRTPGNARALTIRAGFLFAERKNTEAIEAATQATTADPSYADAFLILGEARRALRYVEEAKAAYTEVLKLRPADIRAQLALSQLHLMTGAVDEARQLAVRATEAAPQALATRAAVAKASVAAGNLPDAEREITAIVRDFPQSADAQNLLGILRYAQKNLPAAERAFSTALQLRPASLDAVAGMMAIDLASGRTAAARQRVDRILANDRPTIDALILAASTYRRLNDLPQVERVLRQAIQVDPARIEPYGMLGQLYVEQRRMDQALREFQELAQRQPTSVGAHTLIGALFHQQNRRAEAKAAYRKTLAIDRTAPVAANNLAWMMMEDSENIDEALQLAQAAKSRLPDSGDVADTLGWLYFKKGLAARAIEELKPAVERNPANAGYRYHLGFVYAESGYLALAQETLQAAVKLNPKAPEAAEAQKVLARLATN